MLRALVRSRTILVAVLSAGLGLAACQGDEPSRPSSVSELRRVRTFERWLADSGTELTDDQRARYERGEALLGLVPPSELPVLHERSGMLETDYETNMAIHEGKLDFKKDFAAWERAGLFNPDDLEEAIYAEDYVAGTDDTARREAAVMMPPEPVEGGPGQQAWNCIVHYKATSAVEYIPSTGPGWLYTTQIDPNAACGVFNGLAEHLFTWGPKNGSHSYGGHAFKISGTTGGHCLQRDTGVKAGLPPGLSPNTSWKATISVRATLTDDLGWPVGHANSHAVCPDNATSYFEVISRAQSKLDGMLHLNFTQNDYGFNPGSYAWRRAWGAKAEGTLSAYANGSNGAATGGGRIELGSDCSTFTSAGFGVTVPPAAAAQFGQATWCKDDAWPNAGVAQDKPIFAHLDDSGPISIRGHGSFITIGGKATAFESQATSAIPANNAPSWSQMWGVDSNAWSTVKSGCMLVQLEEQCKELFFPPDGVRCMVDDPKIGYVAFGNPAGDANCTAWQVPP